jgi:2-C-methyl-D-erythritol 4-phosphate cytidylyltransferase
MNSEVPKQFLLLAGQPLLMHSIRIFHLFDPEMTLFVALPENQFDFWQQLCKDHFFKIPHQLIKGGETRFGSVKNALKQVEGDGLVAIHDGVRPLVSMEVIKRTFAEADKFGNAIPVIKMQESIREITPWSNKEVNRGNLRIVQTPQVFRKTLIKEAYTFVSSENFTDDATVVEKLGVGIHLVEGNPENIKITRPSDLRCAEAILGYSALQD